MSQQSRMLPALCARAGGSASSTAPTATPAAPAARACLHPSPSRGVRGRARSALPSRRPPALTPDPSPRTPARRLLLSHPRTESCPQPPAQRHKPPAQAPLPRTPPGRAAPCPPRRGLPPGPPRPPLPRAPRAHFKPPLPVCSSCSSLAFPSSVPRQAKGSYTSRVGSKKQSHADPPRTGPEPSKAAKGNLMAQPRPPQLPLLKPDPPRIRPSPAEPPSAPASGTPSPPRPRLQNPPAPSAPRPRGCSAAKRLFGCSEDK